MSEHGPKKVSFELMAKASEVAQSLAGAAVAVVLGGDDSAAVAMGEYGAQRALVSADKQFGVYHGSAVADTLSALIAARQPRAVFLAATGLGKDVLARVAALNRLGMLADCVAVTVKDGAIVATESAFGGNVLVDCVCLDGRTQLLSFPPNTFPAAKRPAAHTDIERVAPVIKEKTAVRVVERRAGGASRVGLEEASIIVAGGRGMGGADRFAILEELAAELGAAIGASRAAVDAGWRPYSEQVGQTGKTVKPNVYIACGISGAIQHKVGMQTAEHIIAISKDAEAPIFTFADVGVVGDVFEVVPRLTAEIRKRKA